MYGYIHGEVDHPICILSLYKMKKIESSSLFIDKMSERNIHFPPFICVLIYKVFVEQLRRVSLLL